MVALFSPPVFSTKGWLLEEEPLSYDVSSEYSFPYQFYSPQTQIELEIERSSAPSPEDPAMVKKLSHNASERDRRKKVNDLVSSLRSLLPGPDQTVLYIPSLSLTIICPFFKLLAIIFCRNQFQEIKMNRCP